MSGSPGSSPPRTSLVNFTLTKDTSKLERIFGNFENRLARRRIEEDQNIGSRVKASLAIPKLDELAHGGVDEGDIALFLAQSGVGKTKYLKWTGVYNATIKGLSVLHVQLEGTKKECESGYDATWTACNLEDIEKGSIDGDLLLILQKSVKEFLALGGEIYIEAPEKFGSVTLVDLRNILLEFEKAFGKVPDLVLIDYFELLEVGDGKVYQVSQEKERRQALGRGLKNIAVELKVRVITCTQASAVSPEDLNNPEFHMTRWNLSRDKDALAPFSYFFTMNQTSDEQEKGMMRIFSDKVRKYRVFDSEGNRIFKIMQNYAKERFYDHARTRELESSEQNV